MSKLLIDFEKHLYNLKSKMQTERTGRDGSHVTRRFELYRLEVDVRKPGWFVRDHNAIDESERKTSSNNPL